ncbi:unnamed protein product [Pleuronectes platessa]|uniref:Uncharacterized protein n=1 Tax=Pleuronectes platessa TaxID=8262 RepID=A0A9N7YAY1_PLEPL|nr:unnamed protein product [Pleuronectes platessa]
MHPGTPRHSEFSVCCEPVLSSPYLPARWTVFVEANRETLLFYVCRGGKGEKRPPFIVLGLCFSGCGAAVGDPAGCVFTEACQQTCRQCLSAGLFVSEATIGTQRSEGSSIHRETQIPLQRD